MKDQEKKYTIKIDKILYEVEVESEIFDSESIKLLKELDMIANNTNKKNQAVKMMLIEEFLKVYYKKIENKDCFIRKDFLISFLFKKILGIFGVLFIFLLGVLIGIETTNYEFIKKDTKQIISNIDINSTDLK